MVAKHITISASLTSEEISMLKELKKSVEEKLGAPISFSSFMRILIHQMYQRKVKE